MGHGAGPHHRIRTDSRPRGRAAELAAHVRAAGAAGISQRDLKLAMGIPTKRNISGMLATVTPYYPEIAEDDGGRQYWMSRECEA